MTPTQTKILAAIQAFATLKIDYLTETFDPDVANAADGFLSRLMEETRGMDLPEQVVFLIEAASSASGVALGEGGSAESAGLVAQLLAEALRYL